MFKTVASFAREGGLVIIGGLDADEQEYINITRWLLLKPITGGATLSEINFTELRRSGSQAEAEALKTLMKEREIGTYILEAEGVYKHNVTQPLSLSIRSREVVILTGVNGIGKSTFGQILVGRVKKRQVKGSLTLVNNIKPFMAPQSPSEMLLGLDVDSELSDPKLKELCGLNGERDGNLDPRGFSHGMQKLIGIANALRLSKGLAILDEPTSGMDFEQKKLLVGLLNHFSEHAILIITHDPSIECLGRVVEMKEVDR
jgi:ATPase subunit of ABC transporter with duplicated ATPase domains